MALALLAAGWAPVGAQIAEPEDNPRATHITRDRLQQLATEYRGYAASSAYSDSLRAVARQELRAIENRLTEGDFSEGEVITLRVRERTVLTDTFVVAEDRAVFLPEVGTVSLRGVLRSELSQHLKSATARIFRDPEVSAAPMVRLAVVGEVNTPGYYLVSTGTPITDVLMTAGGPTALAKLEGLRIERGDSILRTAGPRQQAETVGQLNLRSGDQVVVPPVDPSFSQRLAVFTTPLTMVVLVTTTWLRFR